MASAAQLPEALHEGFSTAMGQSILLPAAVILLGAAVALFFAKPKAVQGWGGASGRPPAQDADASLGSRTGWRCSAGALTAAGRWPACSRRLSPAARWSGCRRWKSPGCVPVASEPLLLTSERHCSVSPEARASWAAIEAASDPSPRRRHSGATRTPMWARIPSHSE